MKGQVDYAVRNAQVLFDKWNETTGAIMPVSSMYAEMLSLIEDAVHIGIQTALNGKINFNSDGEVVKGTIDKPQHTR
jgi:hypothetical protein